MNVAFYAPLKAPVHPNPSGDRLVARLLMQALERAGHGVALAARLRSWDGAGDAARQRRLRDIGRRLAERLLRHYARGEATARPALWFTYHVYHKAPDWIGPVVADALDIPYVVAEASYAPKQAQGPWRLGHEQARACIMRAEAVVALNTSDVPCVRPLVHAPQRLAALPPFLDVAACERLRGSLERDAVAAELDLDVAVPWLIAVARMRVGDKLASYRQLAAALGRLTRRRWQLLLVGDGPARGDVEAAFAQLPRDRVRFLGQLEPRQHLPLLPLCDVFVWPAVNEAYGMALMEGQACGVPVVAGRSGGVADIVQHDRSGLLVPPGDTAAFAAAVERLLEDDAQRRRLGENARHEVRRRHDVGAAAAGLDEILLRACASRRARAS